MDKENPNKRNQSIEKSKKIISMCCGGTTQKPSDVMATIQARKVTTKVVPMPIPPTEKTDHYSIPKEIKQQLLMQQQYARIPPKTG